MKSIEIMRESGLRMMELVSVSKFRLKLRALISEVRELREREHSINQQLHLSIQKQKQTEAEFGRKFQELNTELDSRDELRRNLEMKVKFLQNDNLLLEKKQKELKGTIDSLLHSRETFVSLYEDSTCELKRSIEIKNRKLAVFSEKIHSHLLLFDTIEKEAVAVKHLADSVQRVVNEKEDVVAGIKRKMDRISTFEKEFVEKISFLENKLRSNQTELQRKDGIISELKEQLEAANVSGSIQLQIEELQKDLSLKEDIIQNLTAEKKALHFEVQSLELILQNIQDSVIHMNGENQSILSSAVEGQEEACPMIRRKENNRLEDMIHEDRRDSPCKDMQQGTTKNKDLVPYQDHTPGNSPSDNKHIMDSCISEAYSDPQSTTNVLNIPTDEKKDGCTSCVHQLDSESSTTEGEASAAQV